MLPNWQRYPNIANYYPPYNYDYLSTTNLQLNDFIHNTITNGTIGLSQPYMLPDP